MAPEPAPLIKILIALAGIVVVFVAIVATRPSEYRVARMATIAAPAPAVFAELNDFHNWEAWSPWAKLDPAPEFTFTPEGDRTVVTWSMAGRVNFMAKAVHLFMNMDRMIGDNLEKELARMKTITEAASSTGRRQG